MHIIEYQVYQFIKDKTLYQIENKQEIKNYAGRLSDADISDMDTFLVNLSFVLPALGVNILTSVVKNLTQLNTQVISTEDESKQNFSF